ncbi:MAG: hypothetical protein H0W41_05295 [Chloroflexi bacterium]|nr:hypothetical protein [Chloroflexota bacterium]
MVLTVDFTLAGQHIQGLDGGSNFPLQRGRLVRPRER